MSRPSLQDHDPRDGAQDVDLATRHVLPAVARHQPRSEALVWVGGLAAITLLGLATFWSMSGSRAERAPAPQPSVTPTPAPVSTPQTLSSAVPPAPLSASMPAGTSVSSREITAVPGPNPLSNPTVVFDSGAISLPEGAITPAQETKPVANTGAANGGDDFASRLGTAGNGSASASASFDPHTTIAQGTLIPAVLETAINTDVPGYARAVVSADVRSFDGTRVLVPRSSRLVGQYKSGIQAGQRRVYVIWTRLIRPDGVSVNIGSPGSGNGGEPGLGGQVNTHFFERFGSGMLLTVMSGLSAIGSGGTNIVIAGSGQSAAAAAVGQTGQIGPTIRVHPGEPLRVFTARDLDFAKAVQ